ncbi:twin-arginine translocase subunit TatB [Marinomonas sp. CT5]|uniref:Sec-independent protein translocase protein TatB n=1 Tax=Marinomonas sp. CT5 TaxID=2066133 RepID=UPI001BAEDF4A|nr:Sec-independent protein translocase protein TatB [Marinomonas sp. CT5]QUX94455.1 twin-arginine translocase subunit TatB [Marinomonas sp. CT5]
MFDIGFSELLVVFVVGLLILGPERLPHAAKTAGLWVRKIRRSINSVQREINAQLDHEELQQKINATNQRLLKEGQAIQNTIAPLPKDHQNDGNEIESPMENIQDSAEVPPPKKDEVAETHKMDSTEPLADDINKTTETTTSRT